MTSKGSKAHKPTAIAVILGYEPSFGPKRTSPHHPAPPANEVTSKTCEVQQKHLRK
jgi:hypothetical protein